MHTVKCVEELLFNSNNSIKHHSLVATHFNDKTVLFQTIHIKHKSFVCSQFKWRRILHFPKLQYYWSHHQIVQFHVQNIHWGRSAEILSMYSAVQPTGLREEVSNMLELHKMDLLTKLYPRSSHTKKFKMVLDTSWINTQHYEIRIKGKVEQYREKSSALPYTSV